MIEFTYDVDGKVAVRTGRRCRILGPVGFFDYLYEPQGNLIETKVYSGALPTDPVEIFDVDFMNRIAGYLRQDGGAGTQARFSVGYFDGTAPRAVSVIAD